MMNFLWQIGENNHREVLAHEAPKTCGFGAEMAATLHPGRELGGCMVDMICLVVVINWWEFLCSLTIKMTKDSKVVPLGIFFDCFCS